MDTEKTEQRLLTNGDILDLSFDFTGKKAGWCNKPVLVSKFFSLISWRASKIIWLQVIKNNFSRIQNKFKHMVT